LTEQCSIILAPCCFAAFAKTLVTPTGSACPSFGICTPPIISSLLMSGYNDLISSLDTSLASTLNN